MKLKNSAKIAQLEDQTYSNDTNVLCFAIFFFLLFIIIARLLGV